MKNQISFARKGTCLHLNIELFAKYKSLCVQLNCLKKDKERTFFTSNRIESFIKRDIIYLEKLLNKVKKEK